MIGAERLTVRFAEKMIASYRASGCVNDVLAEAHEAYARDHAEVLFLRKTDPIFSLRAAEHTAMAVAAQLAAVGAVNGYFLGDDRDPSLDDRCRGAVARGFWNRLAELQLAAGTRL